MTKDGKLKPVTPFPVKSQATTQPLQRKMTTPAVGAASALGQRPKTPVAPPVYRPLPLPKVLQTKSSSAGQNISQPKRPPAAPPARPQHSATVLHLRNLPLGRPPKQITKPSQSPVNRPLAPPRVLQSKTSTDQIPSRPVRLQQTGPLIVQ